MRKISAQYIFPVTSKPLKRGILVFDDTGVITDIIDTNGNLKESAGVEFYDGVIVPGFVNSHCHLELSYLKGKIRKNIGHIEFIKKIVENINSVEFDIAAIIRAEKEMIREGIVAVGDVSNRNITVSIKEKSQIYFHTFIELADFFNKKYIDSQIEKGEKLEKEFENSSIVSHSPYTCSVEFIEKTAKLSRNVFSIHNQEAKDEDEMYKFCKGEFIELLKERGLYNGFKCTEKSSLKSYLKKIVNENLNILLVHNLYTQEDDIKFAENLSDNIYWCLCPNSNLYIQDKLPDVQKFIKNNCKITLGTDSLATNDRLSIIEEMKNFLDADFSEILKWATLNGAKALKIDNLYGSIEIGKKPGLNLISNFNFQKMCLKKESFVKKII